MNHAGTYDFFYLPIDFRNNNGNLGYAFLNLKDPRDIVALVEDFSGKRWERYKSDKVCEIAYARIQGKQALMEHFRCSRLMNKHHKYRPLVADDSGQLCDYLSECAEPFRQCDTSLRYPAMPWPSPQSKKGSCSSSSSCSSCSSSSGESSWHSPSQLGAFLSSEISMPSLPSSPGLSSLMGQLNEGAEHANTNGHRDGSTHQSGIKGSCEADVDRPCKPANETDEPLSPHHLRLESFPRHSVAPPGQDPQTLHHERSALTAEAVAAASFRMLDMDLEDEESHAHALAVSDSLKQRADNLVSPMRQDSASAQHQQGGRMQHQLPVGTQTASRLRLDQHLSGLGCGVDGDEVRVCQPRGKIEQQLNRPVRDSDPGEMSFKVPPGAAPAVDGVGLHLLCPAHDFGSTPNVAHALAMGAPAPHPSGPLQPSDDRMPPSGTEFCTIQELLYQSLLYNGSCKLGAAAPGTNSRGLHGQRMSMNYHGGIASPMRSPCWIERGCASVVGGSDAEQFRVDFRAVLQGIDRRTTVMLRNVPNKYSKAALLKLIDRNHAGAYDFFYLPIDFRNKCNLGYAFINFRDPHSIVALAGHTHTHTHTHFRDPYSIVALAGRRHVLCGTCIHLVATLFVHVHVCYGTLNLRTPFSRPPHHTQPEEFSGKRWEHFKSDKVCEVAYGRIQGKAMLMEHFRSSRLIHKHEKYCPLVLP